MPLRTDIDNFVLGEAADGDGHYLFLLDAARYEFVAVARYLASRGYIECVNLVADGYGPTMFLLLMQKARRDGLRGVAPDLEYNSEDAKRMDARFFNEPPPGVFHRPNPDAHHPEEYLSQLYFLASDLIPERTARRNAEKHFGRTAVSRWRLRQLRKRDPLMHDRWHTAAGILPLLGSYLLRSELPFKKRA